MTEAETILKMIETVDPADTEKLDEIDARVGEYLDYNSPDPKAVIGSRENASPELQTEELAELHAIVQAIEYERRNTETEPVSGR
jgi:hypothetical protein